LKGSINADKYKKKRTKRFDALPSQSTGTEAAMGASAFITLFLLTRVFAVNFDWEREQLTDDEALTNKAYYFGSANAAPTEECRSIPGDGDWPCVEDWSAFNETLGGVLLKPRPLASVCYTGEDYNEQKCAQLKQSWAGMDSQ
jgi:hypothetical protein